VLFVDDEPVVCKWVARAFRDEFDVRTATSVEAALALLAADAAQYAALVTDYRMPVRNGLELLRQARRDWPTVARVLLTSVRDSDVLVAAINEAQAFAVLQKPLDLEIARNTLQAAVTTALERRAAYSASIPSFAAGSETRQVTRDPRLGRMPVRTSLTEESKSIADQPRVFLSHSSEDKPVVRSFCEKLQTRGLRPWLDEAELKPGDRLSQSIEQALENSEILVVFLSAASLRSVWLTHEVSYFAGVAKGCRIVPVVLDEVGKALATKLPATCGRLYLDATDPENLEKAAETVRRLARI
jgi:DNA-binding response OmpR family regulator